MLPDPHTSIVIDAITLRGIGSYLYGARLDIKPLTVLCGANGTGKSTWLKALNVIQRSLAEKRLPFAFAVTDWDRKNIQLTNAYYHLVADSVQETPDDPTMTERFGEPGTIGLELRATDDLWLSQSVGRSDEPQGFAKRFLFHSECRAHARFRLRLAHPTHWDDNAPTPHLRDIVEIEIDGKHKVRMEGDRDPLQRFEEGYARPRRSKPYTLYCSRSFLTGCDEEADDYTQIATIIDLNTPRYEILDPRVTSDEVAQVFSLFEQRLTDLLQRALQGYFYLGAIRQPNLDLRLTEDRNFARLDRYVGSTGEDAWKLERLYSHSTMQRVWVAHFTAQDLNYFNYVALFNPVFRRNSPKLERIFERIPEATKERLQSLEQYPGTDWISHESFIATGASLLAEAFNSLLSDRDLYAEDAWIRVVSETDEYGEEIDEHYVIDDNDVEHFVSKGPESLSCDEMTMLNYFVILDAYAHLPSPSGQRCFFGEYLSWWLKDLVDVELVPPNKDQFHVNYRERLRDPAMFLCNIPSEESEDDLARLKHGCFGSGDISAIQPPRQFSAAFHQLFPIIVQLGLMKSGELIGVENPEVHLHPSLQIRVTEMLIHHAASGRRLIVETHSDLLLRRIIRAILEEEISQSQTHICFVELSPSKFVTVKEDLGPTATDRQEVFLSSSLEPIRIDERGRIANWPKGFLDDDIHESQRLMEIMYGARDARETDDASS